MTQTQEVTVRSDKTDKRAHLWKPGQSGNPLGRTKGARNKLSEDFLDVLYRDFKEHGKKVVEVVRAEKPSEYLKVVASLMPKEFLIKETSVGDLSDEELLDRLNAVRALFLQGTGAEVIDGTAQEASEEVTDAITV